MFLTVLICIEFSRKETALRQEEILPCFVQNFTKSYSSLWYLSHQYNTRESLCICSCNMLSDLTYGYKHLTKGIMFSTVMSKHIDTYYYKLHSLLQITSLLFIFYSIVRALLFF